MKTRLTDEEVQMIYDCGDKSLVHFSRRLLTKYFSRDELVATKITRSSEIENLDRVRIGFIKSHLDDRNGAPLTEKQWKKCKIKIHQRHLDAIRRIKKKY